MANEKIPSIESYLIVSSADGIFRSYEVFGLDSARHAVAEEHGYDLGKLPPGEWDHFLIQLLKEFDDQDQWEYGDDGPVRWKIKEEQCYLEVIRITGQ